MQFTNCWGMAADQPEPAGCARASCEYLTSADQQLAFSKAFGPMPSVQSAADQWTSENPGSGAVPRRRRLRAGRSDERRHRSRHHGLQRLSSKVAEDEATRSRSSTRVQSNDRSGRESRAARSPLMTALPRGSASPAAGCPGVGGSAAREGARQGWLFGPARCIVILGVFLLVPVLMALWVSFSDWSGRGQPFSANVNFVGLENYAAITVGGGLPHADFGTALRNNALVRGCSSCRCRPRSSLFLAVLVNRRILRGARLLPHRLLLPVGDELRRDHRAVAVPLLGVAASSTRSSRGSASTGPNWFNDPRGILHISLGAVGVDAAGRLAPRRTASSASRGGTGCAGPPWRCRRSS